MASDVTPTEVWALIKEIGERQKATEERLNQSIALTDRRYAEDRESMAEFRESMGEFRQSLAELRDSMARGQAEFRESMAQFRESMAQFRESMAQSRAEADRRHAEADRRHAETERSMDRAYERLSRRLGDLGDRIGEFAEALIIPAVETLMQSRGHEVYGVGRWFKRRFDGRVGEFDYLLVNAEQVVAVEVKSRLTSTDVDEHLQRLKDFKNYFPEYADRAIVGAVAGMVVDDEAAKHAYRKGLYVLEPCGEAVRIRNDGDFKPRIW